MTTTHEASSTATMPTDRRGLRVGRRFTTAGVHPYEEVEWELRDAVISDWRTGETSFEQRGVEFPIAWSANATTIVAQKYFRGTLGSPARERSVKHMIDRVADTITKWGGADGYFADDDSAEAFNHELKHLLVTQKAAFNSPVWFNVGVEDTPQASACFILSVEDTMGSILNWYVEEGTIFKGGSGSGVNLSRIRSSKERLKGGGEASGPVSFMRGADASAGTIKSGGKTRRAAKMVILDVDHPDIEEFIWCKQREEAKARALREAGFDMDLDGADAASVQYQNANNSVRVTDEFMHAVEQGRDFDLVGVTDGEVKQTLPARDLMRQIARAAWECADPGMQYDTTINDWHTTPNAGRINGSNPCCFTGDTLVLTQEGPMAFELIHKAVQAVQAVQAGQVVPQVRAWDEAAGALVTQPVVNAWVAGQTAELVEVSTAAGESFRCTPEHRFLTSSGSYVEARRLQAGTALTAGRGVVDVAAVRPLLLDQPVPVYDLEVDGLHNFVITTEGPGDGLVVHNSEYMHLDNSACNLASLNLRKFEAGGVFDVEAFQHAVEIMFTAQEIIVGNSSYPTESIAANAKAYRQLGLGYANLGGLLMSQGLAYDSDEGRAWAAAITALMTGHAYRTSAELARVQGPFDGFAADRQGTLRVIAKHGQALEDIDADLAPANILDAARAAWAEALELGTEHGVRNAQASVLAPTGTIGLMMDCDTTGIEPDLGLVKMKKMVGGGSMKIVNRTVPVALEKLGYQPEQIEAILAYVDQHATVEGAPAFKPEHQPVFDCAMGERSISPMGHVKMMSAVQPFISGALSKCVVGETLLPTEDGLIRIESLHRDEAPDSFRGEILRVGSLGGPQKTNAFYFGGARAVRKVTLRSGHNVTGTDNHRLLVASERGEPVWRHLDELQPGEYVATCYGAEMWSPLPARLDDFVVIPPHGSQKVVHLPQQMTTELAFLLGAFAAKGHISRSNWTIVVTNSVDSVLERVQAAWASEFGVSARIVRQEGKCPGVVVASRTIVEFLEHVGCGRRASEKRIPDAVLRSPHEMVLAFLQGLFLDAYASVTHMPKLGICLDAPKLLDDLQVVLTNLGVVHGRSSKDNPSYDKTYDEVYAVGAHAGRLAQLVPFLESDKAARAVRVPVEASAHAVADVVPGVSGRELYDLLPAGQYRRNGRDQTKSVAWRFLLDDRGRHVSRGTLQAVAAVAGVTLPAWLQAVLDDRLHFSPVSSVEDVGEREVFDISVPANHAFVGNGIVNHNTVNLPESATVSEVEELYLEGWRLGLKAIAIYRDNCKVAQPLAIDKRPAEPAATTIEAAEHGMVRRRLPKQRPSQTISFTVGDAEGYLTAGEYPGDGLGEIFVKLGKQGSTLSGVMDAFAIAVSLGLQYGVPLEEYVKKFTNMRFDPAGMTDDPEVKFASSILDYIFRRLAIEYLPADRRQSHGIYTLEERQAQLDGAAYGTTPAEQVAEEPKADAEGQIVLPVDEPRPVDDVYGDAPLCYTCGVKMQRAGSCHVCASCGTTSGCS